MKNIKMKWNADGSLLALSGTQLMTGKDGEERETCIVQFWNPFGLVCVLFTFSFCGLSKFQEQKSPQFLGKVMV